MMSGNCGFCNQAAAGQGLLCLNCKKDDRETILFYVFKLKQVYIEINVFYCFVFLGMLFSNIFK